ncbi:MAG: hypothetical protein QOI31_2462 [Solirubrobacterales bacterium]|jgi:diguanylate cyclase (GGDEF)-like protein|nr:hypothetical protein [Solirubrobacterales bacterium]
MSERQPLQLLLVEDSSDDAALLVRTLGRGGYEVDVSRVETEQALREALANEGHDLVITDHVLRGFDSGDVLTVVAELSPALPCVLVSGKVGEEAVGQAMRQGAVDYVAKDNMDRLPMVVERTLLETARRLERLAAEAEVNRRIAQQATIAEMGEWALSETSFDVLAAAVVTRVAATLDAEIVNALELRADESAFVVRATAGVLELPAGTRIQYGSSESSQANFTLSQSEPVLVIDYEDDKRFERSSAFTDLGIRSTLSVEIPGSKWSFGVLEVASSKPGAFSVADASFITAVAHLLAVALERTRGEDEIREKALRDPLTGLANRTLFLDRLALGLARAKRARSRLAVLFLDIDHFKALNDTLGHMAADALLTQVGERVTGTMREIDTVARFGGDEFVVLCEDLGTDVDKEVKVLTGRLISAFELPFPLNDGPHTLTVSIGIALSDGNLDGEALVRNADVALYRSKDDGRGGWTLATEEMCLAVVERSEIKGGLEHAIESDELLLHYQPIVSLDEGRICAVEALVRWDCPDRGLIPPGEFIPMAEESGLILRLGEWVLRAACRQAAEWRAEFGDQAPLPIHVNFSGRQIAQLSLPKLVGDVLRETQVPASDIALEITETAVMDSTAVSSTVLSELKRMGLAVALDDFGTGYSSLSYLQRFPIDILKIDREFVSPLTNSNSRGSILAAIVGIARALEVGTVAEGVETVGQAAAVAAIGCERAQGYFFARPGPAADVTCLVRDATPLRDRVAEVTLSTPAPYFPWAGEHGISVCTSIATNITESRQAFLAALLAADSDAAEEIAYSALAGGTEPDAVDAQIIGPAMVDIGRLRERGEVSVAEAHLATGIATRTAGVVAAARGFPDGRFKRSANATKRDEAASLRDLQADDRDRTAELRDEASDDHERNMGRPHGPASNARGIALEARASAAEDRQRAGSDRKQAAEDRAQAAIDRESAHLMT